MNYGAKRAIKIIVIAIAFLLCISFCVGLTGAWYRAHRNAKAQINLPNGLFFEINQLNVEDNSLLYYENQDTSTTPIDLTAEGDPNQEFYIANPAITPLTGTLPYAIKAKFEYVFYDTNGNIINLTTANLTQQEVLEALFSLDSNNSPIPFANDWMYIPSTDSYINVDGTTIKTHTESSGTQKVFAEQTVDGVPVATLKLNNWTSKFAGPTLNEVHFGSFTIELKLEILQYNEEALKDLWGIGNITKNEDGNITQITGTSIFLNDGDVVGDGSSAITLENSELNIILPSSGSATIASKALFDNTLTEINITGSPTQPVTIYIGAEAFANSNVVINLSNNSNITYVIANNAVSTGTINYGSTNITSAIASESITTAGSNNAQALAGYSNVTVFEPGISLIASTDTSYGAYEFTDSQGIWYYDLIDSNGNVVTLSDNANYFARIRYCQMATGVVNFTIPAQVGNLLVDGVGLNVSEIYNKSSSSIFSSTAESVIIPEGITSIGASAFFNCVSLTSINIPSGLKSIGNYAFAACGFKTVTIPDSVTSMGDYVFNNCTSLQSVTIGNGVKSIGTDAFCFCISLKNVIIGNSVTSIENSAFSLCIALQSITIKAITPPTLDGSTFNNTSALAAIYVPAASVEAYQMASGWSDCARMIQAIVE